MRMRMRMRMRMPEGRDGEGRGGTGRDREGGEGRGGREGNDSGAPDVLSHDWLGLAFAKPRLPLIARCVGVCPFVAGEPTESWLRGHVAPPPWELDLAQDPQETVRTLNAGGSGAGCSHEASRQVTDHAIDLLGDFAVEGRRGARDRVMGRAGIGRWRHELRSHANDRSLDRGLGFTVGRHHRSPHQQA